MAGVYRVGLRRSDDPDAEQPFHLVLVEENGQVVMTGETRTSGTGALHTARNLERGVIRVDEESFAAHGIKLG